MVFIEAYLKEWYGPDTAIPESEAEHLYHEANQWSLVSHLLWGVWGLLQATHSSIDFDFIEYSNKRLGFYFDNRDAFVASGSEAFKEYKYAAAAATTTTNTEGK